MVHLGKITNAKGEDVTELVRTGQYYMGERAMDFLNRIIHSGTRARITDRADAASATDTDVTNAA